MSVFKDLKPGDTVVYYQWHAADQWPHAGIDKVRSNDGEIIRLDVIWGWKFRVSDGNPVGFDENPKLCAYIVPTTPALVDRVRKQLDTIAAYRDKREFLAKINWHHVSYSDIDKIHALVDPNRNPWGSIEISV